VLSRAVIVMAWLVRSWWVTVSVMGMSTAGNKGSVQRDINVTPLIDVLLVLLIIFLVVMPLMMKMETLEVPRKLDDDQAPDPNASLLTIKVKADLSVLFNDGDRDTPIQATDMARTLRPKLEAMHGTTERVVFVDFEDVVPWNQMVMTMDTIRGLAADVDHDAIKVALKVK
jgi:biopolymer transport protein TolR